MNIQAPRAFQDALSTAELNEEGKMEQIRELLYGEFRREHDNRVAQLEQRVRELELGLFRRLDALQARLDALNGEITAERRTQFDELARGLLDLGERVRRITRE